MQRHNKRLAKLVEDKRKMMGISRSELGRRLGYKGGQFMFNFASKGQTFPVGKIKILSEVTGLDISGIRLALIEDFCDCLNEEIMK